MWIRSLASVPRFFIDAHTFSGLPQNATYRPLVTLSLALGYAVGGGLDPRAFHLMQPCNLPGYGPSGCCCWVE